MGGMPRSSPKPDNIALVRDDFETVHQEEAAKAILEHWDDADHNLSEIARRSGFSSSHISNVYRDYFAPADEVDTLETQRDVEAESVSTSKTRNGRDVVTKNTEPNIVDALLERSTDCTDPDEAFLEGFVKGYRLRGQMKK